MVRVTYYTVCPTLITNITDKLNKVFSQIKLQIKEVFENFDNHLLPLQSYNFSFEQSRP